jgi:hypothetical protein
MNLSAPPPRHWSFVAARGGLCAGLYALEAAVALIGLIILAVELFEPEGAEMYAMLLILPIGFVGAGVGIPLTVVFIDIVRNRHDRVLAARRATLCMAALVLTVVLTYRLPPGPHELITLGVFLMPMILWVGAFIVGGLGRR